MELAKDLLSYVDAAPSAAHAGCETAKRLLERGYILLEEKDPWHLVPGGKYMVRRGLSGVIAFRLPKGAAGFMMVASHSDSPTFHVNPQGENKGKYTRLSVEKYGGMICHTWMDKPLSVAGEAVVKEENGVKRVPVAIDRDLVIIPSVAIHMDRKANEGATYNPAVDMQPLFGGADVENGTLLAMVADTLGVSPQSVLSMDVGLYNRQKGCILGAKGDLIAAPRLDDLACAYTSLVAFMDAKETDRVPVYVLFDNEEVGSGTYQGAASDFLSSTLERIGASLAIPKEEMNRLYANSMMVSADNAHAVHPNHPEYADPLHAPVLNGGVVIKHNANKRYTTDSMTAALFGEICKRAGVPTQTYVNRADIPGGSTLGAISLGQVSVPSVDVGIGQLAMHSAYETAGAKDVGYMVRALRAFYESSLAATHDGVEIS